MHEWLTRIRGDSTQIVTASHRLARSLRNEFNERQVAAERIAWKTPDILAYEDWLNRLFGTITKNELPVRITAQQSRILWEHALQDQVSDPLVNIASLSRQAREVWKRAFNWQVPFEELIAAASTRDQRVFAMAARKYREILISNNWIDNAALGTAVAAAIREGALIPPPEVLVAGFDRQTPLLQSLLETLADRGTAIETVTAGLRSNASITACANPDAELRAAGAWARARFDENATQRIAIVVTNLDRDADRAGRLVREGFVPGWQFSADASAVNVSFGRRLADYPAIDIALRVLAWARQPINGRDLSLLLRTPFLGAGGTAGRSRLELGLRQLPDRQWTPELALRALGGRDETADAVDWLARLARVAELRRQQPRQAPPLHWATLADAIMGAFNWPGSAILDSADFQLVDRWRDLLNELATLSLVSPTLSMSAAFTQLGDYGSGLRLSTRHR